MAREKYTGRPSYDGKVAVITGAAQGVGAETARLLSDSGAKVALLDINFPLAQEVADEIVEGGGAAIALDCDVSIEESVTVAASQVKSEFGRCDVLVNNASIIRFGALEDYPVETWDQVFAVNVRGYFLCTKHFGRMMLARQSGSIINVVSLGAQVPSSRLGPHSPGFGAEFALTRVAALAWGHRGVRVNSVSPGFVETPMTEYFTHDADAREGRVKMTPLRKIGKPIDIANVISFLGSDLAGYVTGQDLVADGGLSLIIMDAMPQEKAAFTID